MKRIAIFIILVQLCFTSTVWSRDQENKPNWDLFSKNLVKALKHKNLGLNISALLQVIHHKDNINVDSAVLDIVRLYRNHKDERVRQLALVTLHAMGNDWAIGIIKRDFRFEKSPQIKRIMLAIIYDKTKKLDAREEGDKIVASIQESPDQLFSPDQK